MSSKTATLREEIASLERKFGTGRKATRQAEPPVQTERQKLASEIDELERQLEGGMYMDEPVGMGSYMDEPVVDEATSYMDDDDFDDDFDDDDLDDDDDDLDSMLNIASEIDSSGIEEQITQDRFHEVEDLRNAEGIADADQVLDVAPTRYTASVGSLKSASVRLDKVADYVEKCARAENNKDWMKLAYRIDQIGERVDTRIRKIEETV